MGKRNGFRTGIEPRGSKDDPDTKNRSPEQSRNKPVRLFIFTGAKESQRGHDQRILENRLEGSRRNGRRENTTKHAAQSDPEVELREMLRPRPAFRHVHDRAVLV